MATINAIQAREILDSRGNPTVEVVVRLDDSTEGIASVPSGASTGTHEAHELRDGDPRRYAGKGVLSAVANVNGPIAKLLLGVDASQQQDIDDRMCKLDGTPNKAKLGANAILGVSLAVARAAAGSRHLPLHRYLREAFFSSEHGLRLPTPMMNVLNGGAHANWCLDFQEFMLLPQQAAVAERVRCGVEVFHALGAILRKRKLASGVGDEGGYAAALGKNEAALKLLLKAITAAGYAPGKDVQLGIDVAASEFYDRGKYRMHTEGRTFSADQLIARYQQWVKRYPLATIEDGLAEDDWDGWQKLTKALGSSVTLVGDDLFVTNQLRLEQGVQRGVANAVLVKVNQIGSLSETIKTMQYARANKYALAVSHRSGETNDDFIVDLAAAANAEYLKAGSLSRGERLAKWNRLVAISGS